MRHRFALAVLGLLLTGLLLGGGQRAIAAGPVQPVSVGPVSLSNIMINGIPGTQLVVAAGSPVTVSANWTDNNGGCPGCLDWVPVAFPGALTPAGCIEDPGFFGASGSGSVSLGPAPTTPGTYDIVAQFAEQFSCAAAWPPGGSGALIAQIIVLAPAPNTGNFPAMNFQPLTPGANFDPRCSFGCPPGGLP